MNPITAPVVIQATPAINPALPVPMAGATQWLRLQKPGGSPYTQTLGGGAIPVLVAKTPGTRGSGFAGGAAPGSTFTLTVHGGGAVQIIPAAAPGPGFGAGANPFPLPPGGAPPRGPVGKPGPHICGGGAALFNGVVGINGDLVVWGKIYAPGDTHPPMTLRGNSASTTAELQDIPYYHGTALTAAVANYAGLTAASVAVAPMVISYVSGVTVSATFDPSTCSISVAATTTVSTASVLAYAASGATTASYLATGLTWSASGTVAALVGFSASSAAGSSPKLVMVAGT